jgi:hypothetical protein
VRVIALVKLLLTTLTTASVISPTFFTAETMLSFADATRVVLSSGMDTFLFQAGGGSSVNKPVGLILIVLGLSVLLGELYIHDTGKGR